MYEKLIDTDLVFIFIYQMSFPDYDQKPYDHRACLILVQSIGSHLLPEHYSLLLEQLSTTDRVHLSAGGRNVHVKFVPSCPTANNEWGDFQHHRKVLGLVCVAQAAESVTGSEVEALFLDTKNLYDSSVIDSRLVVLGLPRQEKVESSDSDSHSDDGLVIRTDHFNEKTSKPDVSRTGQSDNALLSDMSELTRKHVLTYDCIDDALAYINPDIECMCQSMYYVLESKRLTATNAKLPPLLVAPFEKMTASVQAELDNKLVGFIFYLDYDKVCKYRHFSFVLRFDECAGIFSCLTRENCEVHIIHVHLISVYYSLTCSKSMSLLNRYIY